MSKTILKDEDAPDYVVLGFITPIRDYRLCWLFSQVIGVDFEKLDDLDLSRANNVGNQRFSRYRVQLEEDRLDLHLLANHGNGTVRMIPKLKEFDHFLLIEGPIEPDRLENYKRALQSMDDIQLVKTLEQRYFDDLVPIILD